MNTCQMILPAIMKIRSDCEKPKKEPWQRGKQPKTSIPQAENFQQALLIPDLRHFSHFRASSTSQALSPFLPNRPRDQPSQSKVPNSEGFQNQQTSAFRAEQRVTGAEIAPMQPTLRPLVAAKTTCLNPNKSNFTLIPLFSSCFSSYDEISSERAADSVQGNLKRNVEFWRSIENCYKIPFVETPNSVVFEYNKSAIETRRGGGSRLNFG